jgi:hypothetical protein
MSDQTPGSWGRPRNPKSRATADPGRPAPRKRRRAFMLVMLATNGFFAVLLYGALSRRSGCGGMTGDRLTRVPQLVGT